MAINWEYIKGQNIVDSTTKPSRTAADIITTFLTFSQTEDTRPTLKLGKNINSLSNLGDLVTTNGFSNEVQSIDTLWLFKKRCSFGSTADVNYINTITDNSVSVLDIVSANGLYLETKTDSLYNRIAINKTSINNLYSSNFIIKKYNATDENYDIKVNENKVEIKRIVDINNTCNALNFNVTSDRRAKNNLHAVQNSALDIIKQLTVYTFNYNFNPTTKCIGVMAQDLVDVSINDEFSFVENMAASGVVGDYMAVKESKLIYLLIKAVQEQQVEIENLKEQLKNR